MRLEIRTVTNSSSKGSEQRLTTNLEQIYFCSNDSQVHMQYDLGLVSLRGFNKNHISLDAIGRSKIFIAL